jgi:prepilin-type N-terminal cleavage/methylation domain-containing protein
MRKQAFTLLEVIISSLILSITVAGVLYIFSAEKGVVARTGRRVIAMEDARRILETLRNKVNKDEDEEWPDGDSWFEGTHTETIGSKALFNATRIYTVEDIDLDSPADGYPDYKKVTVTISWSEPTE